MTPKAKPKGKTGSKSPPEAPSPEYQAFEKLAKQVLSVPKEELDRREAEAAKQKKKRSS